MLADFIGDQRNRGLIHENGDWDFIPDKRLLQDGLPADAFVDLEGRSGRTPRHGARGLNPEEILRMLEALPYHGPDSGQELP